MSAPAPNHQRAVLRILWGILLLNWLVAVCKMAVGTIAGNLTIVADGFHSLLDGANNIVGIVAMHIAAKPPDADHPYGHRKFEHVAAMMIGGLVMLLCWETAEGALLQLSSSSGGVPGSPSPLLVAIVASTLLVNLGVSWWERRAGDRLGSPLLKADAAHTASDVAVTSLGLGSMLLGGFHRWIDPLLSLVVVVFLVRAAWSIIRDNLATMTDQRRLDPKRIRDVAEAIAGVRNAHSIRSHGMENDTHVDLHIVVDESMTAREVAELEELVRVAIRAAFPGVTLIGIEHQTHEEEPHEEQVWRA
jgi:cation diffusion facilitator family transporter